MQPDAITGIIEQKNAMLEFTHLIATPGQFQGRDVFIRIFLFMVCAGILFAVGLIGQTNGRAKPWVKYLGVLPVIGCMFFGWPYFHYANDAFIKAASPVGGNSLVAYNTAFILPAVLAPLMIVFSVLYDKKRKANSEMY